MPFSLAVIICLEITPPLSAGILDLLFKKTWYAFHRKQKSLGFLEELHKIKYFSGPSLVAINCMIISQISQNLFVLSNTPLSLHYFI